MVNRGRVHAEQTLVCLLDAPAPETWVIKVTTTSTCRGGRAVMTALRRLLPVYVIEGASDGFVDFWARQH
jgi:hypothetical protein